MNLDKNLNSNDQNLFHCFTSLGNETMKQDCNLQNNIKNNLETISLKSLALKVLERNKSRNKDETEDQNLVSSPIHNIKQDLVNYDFDHLLYLFNERAGIYQFDSVLSQQQSEQKAFSDLVISYANDNNLSFDQDQNQIEEFMQDLTKIIKEND